MQTHIVSARWTAKVNLLIIQCGNCNKEFEHRADRWVARCPVCDSSWPINKLRKDYANARI